MCIPFSIFMHKYKLNLSRGFFEIDLYQLSMNPDTSGTVLENSLNVSGLEWNLL